ncbi:TonB-dependent receptor [Taibaiella soli]|uniref:TonB-dependent receptor n=1 Tax=Taibaiella soli TaxID=1649169 RepID=A0A2W2AVU6_9BACT|nr:TonB-dependent receptor [Taibaiella soli]PZF71798.1 TonB-dependent receptor [Taibaiella soli]
MKNLLPLLSLLFFVPAKAQIISGIIIDAETKAVLVNASVRIAGSTNGTYSDKNGKFVLMLSGDRSNKQLISTHIGYNTDTILITEKTSLTISLSASNKTLNELVISGVSKATRIKENPVAITAVSSKTIERASENNIIDVLVKNVPGLTAVKTGPNISKPFIRGLGYNRVLTLYDGIRQEGQQWGDEHGIEVDGYNVDRAEVIKGPASLMYGSDALAGVISLFPYMPPNNGKIIGRFISEYQSNNGLIGTGLRLGYRDNKWMWQVRGSYRIAKNYKNNIDGRVYNTGFNEKNVAAATGYYSKYGKSLLNFTLYDNLQGIPDGSRDSTTRQFTKQVFEGTSDDITQRPVVNNEELNSYRLSPLHQHIQHYRVYTNNHYELGKSRIDALLGWQQNIRREYNHPTQPHQAGMYVRLNTLNYDLRYAISLTKEIDFTVGANGMYQNNKSLDATDFPIPDYTLFDVGAYACGKWKHKKMTMSGGVRYDTRQVNSKDFYVRTNAQTGFGEQVRFPDTANTTLQFPAFQKNYNGISVSIGGTYEINPHLSLKINIAKGYRSPNITESLSNGLDPGAHIIYLGNRNFEPETNWQEDIGAFFQFDDFAASLSVFNNNVLHYIYLTQLADAGGNPVIDAQGNKTFQYQQSTAQLYGAEASLDIHPMALKGFDWNNNFALIYGFNRNETFKDQGNSGAYLPLTPPAKLITTISQEFVPKWKYVPTINISAAVEYNAAQNRYLSLYNTESATPSYTLCDVAAGAEIRYAHHKTLQLRVQVNNVFDLACQSNMSRLKYFEYYSASPNGHYGIYGMGRNLCVKLIVPF